MENFTVLTESPLCAKIAVEKARKTMMKRANLHEKKHLEKSCIDDMYSLDVCGDDGDILFNVQSLGKRHFRDGIHNIFDYDVSPCNAPCRFKVCDDTEVQPPKSHEDNRKEKREKISLSEKGE